MRVQDDVAGGISTFYAEILRIKEMAEYIRKGEGAPALCLIDEIFKGTNSADRIVGAEEALKKEGISKAFGLVFRDNDAANEFWENQGYSVRTNLNYRNKSLNAAVPKGE